MQPDPNKPCAYCKPLLAQMAEMRKRLEVYEQLDEEMKKFIQGFAYQPPLEKE